MSRGKAAAYAAAEPLLLPEGHAVGTCIHSGIGLMGANQTLVQRTVICLFAVVSALMNSALNGLVCMTVHNLILLY